jgi:class 3 adenylate cyclase
MAEGIDLQDLLDTLDSNVRTELASTPEVVDTGHELDINKLPIVARRWMKVRDVVAVVADLKNLTQLGTDKWAASTASIYQAATGGVVDVLDEFAANFIQIQGDGAFGLFWGEGRYARAVCAGITIKTFNERSLVERLEAKWASLPETGFKVGVANSRILVKKIGTPRNPAQQEPVWAGKAVNYAAKSAQAADRHVMVVTGSVWDWIEKNDFLAVSCPCGSGPSLGIWSDTEIDRIPEGDPEAQGRALSASWCDVHGSDYCDAVMSGKNKRDDTANLRQALDLSQMRTAIRAKARQDRASRLARLHGLAS